MEVIKGADRAHLIESAPILAFVFALASYAALLMAALALILVVTQ